MNPSLASKLAKYCAYQERCTHEVWVKLKSYKASREECEKVVQWLKENAYVDDKRYAFAFVRGKFHTNKWGRIKIRYHLVHKKIAASLIDEALHTIPQDQYLAQLETLWEKKSQSTTGRNRDEINHKIIRSLITKGYEPELIKQCMLNLT
ncbi:MAG: recombinase RecX [Bacteroidetes bacterium]|nr:MAG: recombinase RecX [Bacteroidota bacterium]PIE88479.1 MAG: recombinase RecX [Bacteroidota bacterium]